MDKNIGKNISKNLNGKCSQKLLDHAKQFAAYSVKVYSKIITQKIAVATVYWIGNRIANRIKKISRSSPQNNSEMITSKHVKETPKERYISPEERQKTIDDLKII